jgi:hypothetical protein
MICGDLYVSNDFIFEAFEGVPDSNSSILLLSGKNILRQRKKLNSFREFSFFFVSLFSAQNIFET